MWSYVVPLCQDRIRHMDRSLQQADLDFVMDFFNIVRTHPLLASSALDWARPVVFAPGCLL
jgi:hypothetical protein